MTHTTTIHKTIFAAIFILLTGSAWAQMPSKPGAEVKKLDYFAGSWTTEGTISQGPWGSGGKFSSTNTSEWMPGGFFLISHRDFHMPPELGGDGSAIDFFGYDTNQNTYTRDEFNSQGRRDTAKATFTGDTWTWSSTQEYGGQDIQQKMTLKIVSPTSYTFKFDVSVDGTNWMPFMEAKATKK
jgi:hypothetical protein